MRMSIRVAVFWAAVIPLLLAYYPVRRYLDNDLAFVAVVVMYLAAARLIAEFVARWRESR